MEFIHSDLAPKAIGPYSQAVRAGQFLWLSGQIPLDSVTGNLVEGGIMEQTHQVLNNIQAVLSAAGALLQNVVKTTCFLTNLGDFASFNEVYTQHFGAHKPARSTIQVSALPRGALVEIEVVAYLD